jgi:hypothetical protein
MLPTTRAYSSFLEELQLDTVPFAIHAAAFYFIEAVYNTAWRLVLAAQVVDGRYSQFASRW